MHRMFLVDLFVCICVCMYGNHIRYLLAIESLEQYSHGFSLWYFSFQERFYSHPRGLQLLYVYESYKSLHQSPSQCA